MVKKVFTTFLLTLAAVSAAPAQHARQAQRPYPAAVRQQAPWLVSVVHTVELDHLIARLKQQNQDWRVGVPGSAPQYIFNVVTGLVLDNRGHVITRLANIDPRDKNQQISVIVGNGARLPARLVGVDYATGFAVLQVPGLKASAPAVAAPRALANGTPVKILSADVKPQASGGSNQIHISPSIRVLEGHIGAQTPFAKALGASFTLTAEQLLARNDGGIVTTPDNRVIGIARHRSFGRAYLYPIETLRDTIAKRVIENKDSVPAGWLGAKGDSLAELSPGELQALGLDRRAGVLIREVIPNGPAARGGIKPNDVIVRLGEFEVTSLRDLSAVLLSSPAGENVRVQVIRERQPMEIVAVLGAREYNEYYSPPPLPSLSLEQPGKSLAEQLEQAYKRHAELKAQFHKVKQRPPSVERQEALRELELEARQVIESIHALERKIQEDSKGQAPAPAQNQGGRYSFAIGFVTSDVNPQLAVALGARGVLVRSVLKDSPADRAGLRAGDIIVGTTQEEPLNSAQLQYIFSTRHGLIPLKVFRNYQNDQQTMIITVSNQP
ncbi:MAG TPA: PDZ domain-containing protein [Blastocatellia bacterium]|nr:PDZ domain-containing protein [Blastocatellia bacterium]